MKSTNFLLTLFTVIILAACSEPTVTREEHFATTVDQEYQTLGYQVSFKANPGDRYIVYDDNKECPHIKGSPFRTTKPYRGAPINEGDKCTRCGKSWSLHK